MVHAKRGNWAVSPVILLLIFVLTACSSPSPADQTSSQPNPAEGTHLTAPRTPLPVVRVATVTPKGNSGFLHLAKHKGFFEEEGIKVEHIFIESGTNVVKAMLAGEADVSDTSLGVFLDAMSAGENSFKVVGSQYSGLSYYIFAKNDVRSSKDMEGRTAGVAAPRSFLDEMITLWMINTGANHEKVIRFASGGSAASFQALLAGKIDAVAAGPEYLPIAESDPNVHMVSKLSEDMPNYINFALVAHETMLGQRRDELKAFMKAQARGIQYAIQYPDEANEIAAKILDLPKDDESITFVNKILVEEKLLSPNLEATREQIDYMLETRVIMGNTDKKLPVEQVWDPSIQQEIVSELGEFRWP